MEVVFEIGHGRGIDNSESYFLDKLNAYTQGSQIVELRFNNCDNVPPSVFEELANHVRFVRFLSIRNCSLLHCNILEALTQCTNIQSLKLQNTSCDPTCIQQIIANNPITLVSLKHMCLPQCVFRDAVIVNVQNVRGLHASSFPKIKVIQSYENMEFLKDVIDLYILQLTTVETDFLDLTFLQDYASIRPGESRKLSISMLENSKKDEFDSMVIPWMARIRWVKKLRNYYVQFDSV